VLALRFHVDGLTAIFLLLVAAVAVPATLYSVAYMRRYTDYSLASFYPCLLLFLAGMYGLLATSDMMWIFFGFWQFMVLPGCILIAFEHRKPETWRAARSFLVFMEISCALAMLGAGLLATNLSSAFTSGNPAYDFGSIAAGLPALLAAKPLFAELAFALFFIGFGINAGMWPFGQKWLPAAHASAPAPFSAMLSGIMIKLGVYRLLRCFLWLAPLHSQMGTTLAGWGLVFCVLGTITLFTGTMQALRQEQSKRLLAFHSIGQVGYILLAIGISMAVLPSDSQAARTIAALALIGALFHLINHALFKGLLALNAGSMLYATGTQNLNQMGGLMKYMPLTAITALIASLSISGVPLFNGFVSKWTIYVAAIQGSEFARYLSVCALVAILTSALTLASFIKFFGASFLSRTSALVRERANAGRTEVTWIMQLPQVFLAAACVLFGIVPFAGFRILQLALQHTQALRTFAEVIPFTGGSVAGISPAAGSAAFVPLAIAAALLLMFILAFGISRLGGSTKRAAAPWLCGYALEAESNRYIAHNFYGEIKRYFHWIGGAPPNGRNWEKAR
jgi:formate hydrogenlyase subunit 3/multisubunit Na+/H+ antiporter MnhD subunit